LKAIQLTLRGPWPMPCPTSLARDPLANPLPCFRLRHRGPLLHLISHGLNPRPFAPRPHPSTSGCSQEEPLTALSQGAFRRATVAVWPPRASQASKQLEPPNHPLTQAYRQAAKYGRQRATGFPKAGTASSGESSSRSVCPRPTQTIHTHVLGTPRP